MTQQNYNPDVLSCLASLSNDEVFTPPALVNQILDLLPAELWRNPDARFLDPVSKSGVFLREIAKRLMEGLREQIPDEQDRANHILTRQVFGLAITELTALLSRRSVYCSKTANGPYSVCSAFGDEAGNIRYSRIDHSWVNGKCRYCGASQEVYDRGEALETHAYEFIHTDEPEKIFSDMKFDVIIGNPPYQLADGGGRESAAIPLYHRFVEQAIKLSPTYVCMIIPARWYSGGRGLDEFRSAMLSDNRLSAIYDFPETSDCFPGLNIRGGVCYFLWNKNHDGECLVVNHKGGKQNSSVYRPLLEKKSEVFVRYNDAISILRKVQSHKEETFDSIVSTQKPFGFRSNFDVFVPKPIGKQNIKVYRVGEVGYVSLDQIEKNKELVDKYKVIASKASPGGDEYPHQILTRPIIAEPMSVCTETYLIIKEAQSLQEAENIVSYITTRFFRFMVSLIKNTQNISRGVYAFVPVQDFSERWTDEKLYAKYGITPDEIAFIESMIRPME